MKILGWVGDGDLYGSDRAEDHAPQGRQGQEDRMKILEWVGDGDLYGSDRAEDHVLKILGCGVVGRVVDGNSGADQVDDWRVVGHQELVLQ